MGLFDSTIQTLSNMALNESGFEVPQVAAPAIVDEFKAMLEMMPALNEEEMKFPDYAVPVRESKRLGKYLIEMEDISRFMMTNGLTNILEAITTIGKANGITLDNSNTALVIDEASILQEMDDLGMNISKPNSNEGNIGTVGLLGPHTDIGKFRRFANSREFVDLVANKYGLPIVKKAYSIGLVKSDDTDVNHKGNLQEAAEDTQMKKTDDQQVLNEKDNKPVNEEVSAAQLIRDIALGKYDNELMAEAAGGENFFDAVKKKSLSEAGQNAPQNGSDKPSGYVNSMTPTNPSKPLATPPNRTVSVSAAVNKPTSPGTPSTNPMQFTGNKAAGMAGKGKCK